LFNVLSASAHIFAGTALIQAQSTRPRRTNKQSSTQTTTTTPANDPLLRPEPHAVADRAANQFKRLVARRAAGSTSRKHGRSADTKHAYLAARAETVCGRGEGGQGADGSHPNDPEAWKIAGFAELNLKQYTEAVNDLEKAVELQRRAKQDDPNTESALGQAYVLSEKYQEALPLLTPRSIAIRISPMR
jgi:tetratricopeptide (TPR) repeat protein